MKQKIFAVLTITALLLGSAIVAKTAVSTIAGLAVAQSSTIWNNLKDASVGDNLTNGVMASQLYVYDGTDFDRARGDTTFGLDVDITRMPGSGQTPADAFANPTTFAGGWSLQGLFNGTTWDRVRSASATNNTATTSIGTAYTANLSTWSVTNTIIAAVTAASASRAAGGGTVRHVATTITVCYNDTVAATTASQINLRDGATGAGTIIRSWLIAIPAAGDSRCVSEDGLNMTGSANTAMTLEFGAATAATSSKTVTVTGYSTP